MITKEQERTVVTNVNNSSNFKIQNNAKMFSILSSGIYADPIRAIIRELSCNAIDSHIDAGKKDQPFHVRLPSRFDPKLQIEDFGIGLDHEGVTEVYTTYGMSTKTDSNDVIGALGLGSKTPFSYAETFTIRARKDGVERWYNAYIGNEGFPTISLLSERPTDECNGMMIEVAVKDTDCGRFREKAQQVFKHFKIVPEGLPDNMRDTIRAKSEAMYEAFDNDGFYVDRSTDRGVHAVMGNIAYRIPDNLIEAARDGLDQYLRSRFGTYCIYLPFDIGELDIAANRETLSFSETDDDPTYKAILNKLDDTLGVYLEQIQKDLDACPTWVEACQYIRNNDLVMVSGMFTYQGESVDTVRAKKISLSHLFHHRTAWSSTAFNQYTKVKYETRAYDVNGRVLNYDNLRNRDIASSNGLVVLYNDLGNDTRGIPTSIRWYVDVYGSGQYTIGVKNAISKDVMRRIKERVPNVVFKPISPIMAERKERMDRHKANRKQVEKYQKDSEVKARFFNGNYNCKLTNLDIDELRERGERVVYYRPPDARVVTEWTILGKKIDINDWNRSTLNFFGIDIVIYANQTNMKRILNNKVPNIEDAIKKRIPLMERMVEAKSRIQKSISLESFLQRIRHMANLPGTSMRMDTFIIQKLYDRGYIKYGHVNDVDKDKRLLTIIGARYFAGLVLRNSFQRRMARGSDLLDANLLKSSNSIVNAFVETPHNDSNQQIDNIIQGYAGIVDRFIRDNPLVRHLDPKFEYEDVGEYEEGSEAFMKLLDRMVDEWSPSSV